MAESHTIYPEGTVFYMKSGAICVCKSYVKSGFYVVKIEDKNWNGKRIVGMHVHIRDVLEILYNPNEKNDLLT